MVRPRPKDKVNHSNHSFNPDREKQPKGSTMRTKATIKRLNMYRNFKAKRDKKGNIIRPAPFQSTVPSGTVSRVEPNRRWFGNTRVISQSSLQNFKEAMKIQNPYEIVLRQTKLPISLLDEKKLKVKPSILTSENFSHVFGKKAQRKRPILTSEDLTALVHHAEETQHKYDDSKDRNRLRDDDGVRDLVKQPHFKAGQSKRLWNELFKVLDSSDVVLYVLDARDPMGTRSPYIEKYLKTEKQHKHLIFVINKVDLVPVWVTKRWKIILSEEYPTMIFHADLNKPIGKIALMGLLRQLYTLHSKHRPQISVGIIGYPNVGKSSIINALRNKKVCNVAPLAGETKVWQYVNLMKSIFLIDCPGVVYPDGATEAELVMRGVVRVEYLQQPDLYIRDVLDRVRSDYLQSRYRLPHLPVPVPDQAQTEETASADWQSDPELFLELVSRQTGKLLKGGEPDIMTTAKRVLNDFQRGKLPYFVKPPAEPEDRKEELEQELQEEVVDDLTADVSDEETTVDMNPLSSEVATALETVAQLDEQLMDDESECDDVDESIVGDLNAEDTAAEPANNSKQPDCVIEPLTSKQKRRLERALRKQQTSSKFNFYRDLRDARSSDKKRDTSDVRSSRLRRRHKR